MFPADWNGHGDVPEHGGLVYLGHHITFETTEDGPGILTYADPFRNPPIRFPNRKNLAEWLADPASVSSSKKDTPVFGEGQIVKGEILAVRFPGVHGGADFRGPAKPVFEAYMHYVGKPLIKVLGGH